MVMRAMALVAILMAGCGGPVPVQAVGEPETSVPAASPAPVSHVSDDDDDDRGFVGVVIAREQVDLAAKQPGELREVLVRLGDAVEAGEVVATLDDEDLSETLVIARADRSAAKAELGRASVDLSEATDRHQSDAQASDVIPARELAAAGFAAQKAKSERARASARLAREHARIEQLEHHVAETRVVAPFAGTIAVRYLDPGAVVEPGTAIVRLVASGDPWIRFAIPAVGAPVLAVGDSLWVKLEGEPTRLHATVQQVAAEVDPNSQMLLLEAKLEHGEEHRTGIEARIGAAVWVHATAEDTHQERTPS